LLLYILAIIKLGPLANELNRNFSTEEVYVMEYYSAIKKNEILSFAGKWMELENIMFMLSEVIQVQNVFSYMWKIDPNTNIRIIMFPKVRQLEATKGGGKEEQNDSA
jgi:hypothetical protein